MDFHWTDESIEHIARHGVSVDDWTEAFTNAYLDTISRTTGRPACFGYTDDGRHLFLVYEIDQSYICPITGYEVPE